jgi:hypothetical protein
MKSNFGSGFLRVRGILAAPVIASAQTLPARLNLARKALIIVARECLFASDPAPSSSRQTITPQLWPERSIRRRQLAQTVVACSQKSS